MDFSDCLIYHCMCFSIHDDEDNPNCWAISKADFVDGKDNTEKEDVLFPPAGDWASNFIIPEKDK